MKACRLFLLIFVVMSLVPGATQLAQSDDIFMVVVSKADLVNKDSQITYLYLDTATGDWIRKLPDGTNQTFEWSNGKAFVMTGVSCLFYAQNTSNTNPYRLLFKTPNDTTIYPINLTDVTYGSTVWGGASIVDSITPGIVISAKPSIEVRQLPQPPADPNSGSVITASLMKMNLFGYVVP